MDHTWSRILVVGCGERFASDEVAGLEVAAQLGRTPGHICEVRDIEHCSPSFLNNCPPIRSSSWLTPSKAERVLGPSTPFACLPTEFTLMASQPVQAIV